MLGATFFVGRAVARYTAAPLHGYRCRLVLLQSGYCCVAHGALQGEKVGRAVTRAGHDQQRGPGPVSALSWRRGRARPAWLALRCYVQHGRSIASPGDDAKPAVHMLPLRAQVIARKCCFPCQVRRTRLALPKDCCPPDRVSARPVVSGRHARR